MENTNVGEIETDGGIKRTARGGHFKRSVETTGLIKRLAALEQGETVTYEELAPIALGACAPHEIKNPYLLSARRILQDNERMLFRGISNLGIKRLTDPEIIERSEKQLSATQRKAEAEMRYVSYVDFDKLEPDEKITHNTNISVFNVMKTVSQPQKVAQIKKTIANTGNIPLQIAETIGIFSKDKSE